MKRLVITAALGAALLFSLAVPSAAAEWWRPGFEFAVVENNIMDMDAGGLFHPFREVSRVEIANAIWRYDDTPIVSGMSFRDVRNNPAVDYVSGTGVMKGVDRNHFDPESSITREQFATIIYRFNLASGYKASSPEEELLGYSDRGSISEYARDAVAWASYEGLMTGTAPDVFDPQAVLTRGQIATILKRFSDVDHEWARAGFRIEANETRVVNHENDREIFIDNLGWLLRQTETGVVECTLDQSDAIVTVWFQDGSKIDVDIDGLSYVDAARKVMDQI